MVDMDCVMETPLSVGMNRQNNRILIWNRRGATNPSFYRYRKQYFDVHKLDMLVILETRLDPLRLHKTFINLGFDAFEYLENRGYAGGICVVQKKNKVDVVVHETHFQFIHLRVRFINGPWQQFSSVYVSPIEGMRSHMWKVILHIASTKLGAWLL